MDSSAALPRVEYYDADIRCSVRRCRLRVCRNPIPSIGSARPRSHSGAPAMYMKPQEGKRGSARSSPIWMSGPAELPDPHRHQQSPAEGRSPVACCRRHASCQRELFPHLLSRRKRRRLQEKDDWIASPLSSALPVRPKVRSGWRPMTRRIRGSRSRCSRRRIQTGSVKQFFLRDTRSPFPWLFCCRGST